MKTKLIALTKIVVLLILLFGTYIAKSAVINTHTNKNLDSLKTTLIKLYAPKDGSDVIILKDGSEINCNIVEINDNEVKYKRADNPNGPLISISKEKIFKINYANGTSDFFGNQNFQNNQNVNSNNQNLDKDDIRRKANNALLWSIVSFFIPYLGILIAGVAINQGLAVLRMTNSNTLAYQSERSTANIAIWIATATIFIILTATILLLVL